MSKVSLGKKVPDFELPATGEQSIRLSDLKGDKVVLYFYPKDSTPGCTREGQDFRDNHTRFRRQKCRIFGISRDSLKSHENFKTKQAFPFELLSDKEELACNLFDVIKEKNMYVSQHFLYKKKNTTYIGCSIMLKEQKKALKDGC